MNSRKLFGRYDLFIFAALILAAAVIYVIISRGETGAFCEIKIDGQTAYKFALTDLTEPELEFSLPENPRIRFIITADGATCISSDCPDKICVNTGYIKHTGQAAVCMPNRVSIHITAAGGADIVLNCAELR